MGGGEGHEFGRVDFDGGNRGEGGGGNFRDVEGGVDDVVGVFVGIACFGRFVCFRTIPEDRLIFVVERGAFAGVVPVAAAAACTHERNGTGIHGHNGDELFASLHILHLLIREFALPVNGREERCVQGALAAKALLVRESKQATGILQES